MTTATLVLTMLLTGADDTAATALNNPQAKEAISRFGDAFRSAADEFDKRVSRAREKLIGELSGAATAATRAGMQSEARAIQTLLRLQQTAQEKPIHLPVPLVEASTLLANSMWAVSNKQVFVFNSNGKVLAATESGKTLAEGRWEEVTPTAVTISFRGFYVGILSGDGKAMKIVSDGSTLDAKRLR